MRKMMLVLAAFVVVCALLTGCAAGQPSAAGKTESAQAKGGVLEVKVLDVGQGDAILIRTADEVIFIDTGDVDEHPKLEAALKKENIKTVDKLIITHPHADHLGGASVIFKNCEVKAVYDNGEPTTTKLYRDYLKTIKAKGIPYKALVDGDVLDFGGGVSFRVLGPTAQMVKEGGKKNGKPNLNINSIVGRLEYGDFTMLFTGDAEKETEKAVLSHHSAAEIKSLVLKAPHHGSKTSSTTAFLKAAAPEAVAISCGAGNEYGHPHKEVLERYKKFNIKVYRTDQGGTIAVISDGKTYNVKEEK
ncbi:ComEC/Rec2 family competence protein [Selenomonas sp.]|uniref:ComEC/Rec2 family competence protein n=1 Tax=Selenomonas sp. TaxID=2053611 RepID=UPI003FA30851